MQNVTGYKRDLIAVECFVAYVHIHRVGIINGMKEFILLSC